mgnify:CR=1 FL=1
MDVINAVTKVLYPEVAKRTESSSFSPLFPILPLFDKVRRVSPFLGTILDYSRFRRLMSQAKGRERRKKARASRGTDRAGEKDSTVIPNVPLGGPLRPGPAATV